MSLPECVLCDVKISKDNDTREHLIPNAIGGRKKLEALFVMIAIINLVMTGSLN
ncbi:HNH endonuclease [Paraglaciecola sp. Hal342]